MNRRRRPKPQIRSGVFWNVQRLFSPQGGRIAKALDAKRDGWCPELYERKVRNVGSCLQRIGTFSSAANPPPPPPPSDAGSRTSDEASPQLPRLPEPPALIGLAEVETPDVVRDVMRAAGLASDRFQSVDDAVENPWLDALDVALIYDTQVFEKRPKLVQSIALDNRFATRDLLRVRLGLRHSAHEVEVLVAHWPSRVITEGGALRLAYSIYVHRLLVQILKCDKADIVGDDGGVKLPPPHELLKRWHTPCFIMGDFNDEPFDPSIRTALQSSRLLETVMKRGVLVGRSLEDAARYLAEKFTVYNPCWSLPFDTFPTPAPGDGASLVAPLPCPGLGGTFYRSPEWRIYDQLLVTHGAMQTFSDLRLVENRTRAARLADFHDRESDDLVQMTTARGLPRAFSSRALSGVSDHFPLVWDMVVWGNPNVGGRQPPDGGEER